MIVASIQDLVPELLERCHHFTLRHGPIGGSVGIVRGDDLVWRHEFGWAESATRAALRGTTPTRPKPNSRGSNGLVAHWSHSWARSG